MYSLPGQVRIGLKNLFNCFPHSQFLAAFHDTVGGKEDEPVLCDFLHEEALGEEDKVLARYLKPDLLVIDDMGMKQLPKRSGEYLFEIIMRRYETRSTMMTSNRPLEDWGKLIGDIPSATAILDRFLHHAEIITITGRSYRLRNQGRQGEQAPENDQPSKEGKNDNPTKERKRPRQAPPESPSAE